MLDRRLNRAEFITRNIRYLCDEVSQFRAEQLAGKIWDLLEEAYQAGYADCTEAEQRKNCETYF